MRRLLAIAAGMACCLSASPADAQALDKPDPSVRAWLPGCRAFLEHPDALASEGAGRCAGAVDALLYIGELLPADFRYCMPLRTPRQEIISTVLFDLEALRPEADRRDFKGMV